MTKCWSCFVRSTAQSESRKVNFFAFFFHVVASVVLCVSWSVIRTTSAELSWFYVSCQTQVFIDFFSSFSTIKATCSPSVVSKILSAQLKLHEWTQNQMKKIECRRWNFLDKFACGQTVAGANRQSVYMTQYLNRKHIMALIMFSAVSRKRKQIQRKLKKKWFSYQQTAFSFWAKRKPFSHCIFHVCILRLMILF